MPPNPTPTPGGGGGGGGGVSFLGGAIARIPIIKHLVYEKLNAGM